MGGILSYQNKLINWCDQTLPSLQICSSQTYFKVFNFSSQVRTGKHGKDFGKKGMTFPVLIHTTKLQIIKDTLQERAFEPNLWKKPRCLVLGKLGNINTTNQPKKHPTPPPNYNEAKDQRTEGQMTEDGMTWFSLVPKTLSDKKSPQNLDFWIFSYLFGF